MTKKCILICLTSACPIFWGDTKRTGVFFSEVAHPYHEWLPHFDMDFVSVQGGAVPIDDISTNSAHSDQLSTQYLTNDVLIDKLKNTLSPSQITDSSKYDAIFFAGGHGTMFDFPQCKELQRIGVEIYERGGVFAAVCHGPCVLTETKLTNGEYLIKGKSVTSFTNQEEELINTTKKIPFHTQTVMEQRGAKFVAGEPRKSNIVVDGNLVTGQNPASAEGVGKAVAKLLL